LPLLLAGMILLLPLGFHLGGFPGALAGLLVSQFVMYAVSAAGATRAGLAVVGHDLAFTAGVAAVAGAGWLAGHLLAGRLHANLAGLAGALAVMAVVWVPAGLWYLRREEAFDAIRRRFLGSAR
jgi:hypothetical protein